MSFNFSPEIRKKIIYLDQFVLDFFVKCSHPELVPKMKEADRQRWHSLLERIDRLTKLQLVLCPYSAIHEDESLTASRTFKYLEKMYNYLSRGKSFQHYAWIQREQIGRCFLAWMDGCTEVPLEEFMPPRLGVALSNFHEWEQLSSQFFQQQTPEKSAEISGRRDANAMEMSRVWGAWKNASISPDDYEVAQLRNIVQAPLVLYDEWIRNTPSQDDIDGCISHAMNLPVIAQLIPVMRRQLMGSVGSDFEADQKIREFFDSEAILSAPFAKIQAKFMRLLYRRVKEGRAKKEPPSRGMMNDINMISTYLPYCDVGFIDNECYTLLTEDGGEDVLREFHVKVFCSKKLDDFVSYLEEVEEACPAWQKVLVRERYGTDWPRPYASPF